MSNHEEDCANFCGLLRKTEHYSEKKNISHLVEFLNSGLSYLITTVFTISIFLFFQLYARVDHPQPQQWRPACLVFSIRWSPTAGHLTSGLRPQSEPVMEAWRLMPATPLVAVPALSRHSALASPVIHHRCQGVRPVTPTSVPVGPVHLTFHLWLAIAAAELPIPLLSYRSSRFLSKRLKNLSNWQNLTEIPYCVYCAIKHSRILVY